MYDPQLDRVIDLDGDLREVINEYGRVVAKIPEIVEQGKSRSKRPWWKVWWEHMRPEEDPQAYDPADRRSAETASAIARSAVAFDGRRE